MENQPLSNKAVFALGALEYLVKTHIEDVDLRARFNGHIKSLESVIVDLVDATTEISKEIEEDDPNDDPRSLRVEEEDQRRQDAKDMDGFDMLRMNEEEKL